ncbi:hypothetical protein [Caballeronia temeraria]|nr:hypothetical protein [Caballeronia temeraria]
MPLLDSEELVVVSKERLELYAARLQEVENELCRRSVDEALEQCKARGITLLSPEDLEEEEASPGGKSARVRGRRAIESGVRASKISFFEMFRSLFAKRTKQAG